MHEVKEKEMIADKVIKKFLSNICLHTRVFKKDDLFSNLVNLILSDSELYKYLLKPKIFHIHASNKDLKLLIRGLGGYIKRSQLKNLIRIL